jgi:hypothetical protein
MVNSVFDEENQGIFMPLSRRLAIVSIFRKMIVRENNM